jgi:hypothetical protein
MIVLLFLWSLRGVRVLGSCNYEGETMNQEERKIIAHNKFFDVPSIKRIEEPKRTRAKKEVIENEYERED